MGRISWNIVNSALAGLLVILGALVSGNFNKTAFFTALVTGLAVAIMKFSNFWQEIEPKHTKSSKTEESPSIREKVFSFF